MHTDPIADMLTRIRNAQAVRKPEVLLPYSRIKMMILEIFARDGWISSVERITAHSQKLPRTAKKREHTINRFDQIKVVLKYNEDVPAISSLKRISKPGRRVYVGKEDIPVVLNNFGMAVLSTPRGILTSRDALKQGVGGEVICEVY